MAKVAGMTCERENASDHPPIEQQCDDLEVALEQFWPGNVPEGERSLWDRLPVERKMQAVSRLKALAARSTDDAGAKAKKLPAKEAAEIANISVPTLYAIEKRWRVNPTLLALGVNLRIPLTQPQPTVSTAELYPIIERLLIYDPWQDAPTLFGALQRELKEEARPSFTSVLRIMRQIRPSVPREATFGRRLIFDSAGLDLVDGSGRRMRLCALFDAETMLILGWDLVPDGAGNELTGYGHAARHALLGPAHAHGQGVRFDRSGLYHFDPLARLSAVARPQTIDMHIYALTKKPRKVWLLAQPELEIIPKFKLGSDLIDILGERVGNIWLGPGKRDSNESYRTSRPVLLPQSNWTMIQGISGHIYDHNRKIFNAQEKFATFERLGDVLVDIRFFLSEYIKYAFQKEEGK